MANSYTLPGLPSDLLTTPVEGERRLKVEAEISSLPPTAPEIPPGLSPRTSLMQELLTVQWRDHFSLLFQYSVPINEEGTGMIGGSTAGGSITHADSSAILSATGVGRAWVESRDSIRYAPGHEFGAQLTASVSQSGPGYAAWGLGNQGGVGDAAAFCSKNGVFGLLLRSGGVDTFVPQASFNIDRLDGTGPSGKTINVAAMNLYMVRGGWYGILPISWWWFAGRDIGYVCCHVHDISNTGFGPHLSNPSIPGLCEVSSTAGGAASIKTASWRGGLLGGAEAATNGNRQQVSAVLSKPVPASTAFTPLISMHNPTTYFGKSSHIRARYGTASLACDGTKDVEIIVIKNAVLTGAAFAPKNIAVSPIEFDTAATAMTGGVDIGNQILAKSTTTRINLIQGDAILAVYPGETITIAARSTGNSVVSASLRVLSEF